MIGAPSGVQTKFEKNSLAANSGMYIGTKNVIVFCGDFAQSLNFGLKFFFGHSFYDKNWLYGSMNPFFAQKWVKMAKRLKSKYYMYHVKNLKMSKILKIRGNQTLPKSFLAKLSKFKGHFWSVS